MKANELRIGNLVRYAPKGGIREVLYRGLSNFYQVTCIGGGDKIAPLPQLYLQGASGCLSLHDFDSVAPIPLTEELMLKCGFDKDRNGFWNSNFKLRRGVDIDYGPDNTRLYPTLNSPEHIISRFPVEYLHQLQNLYFALTGEEIEAPF